MIAYKTTIHQILNEVGRVCEFISNRTDFNNERNLFDIVGYKRPRDDKMRDKR